MRKLSLEYALVFAALIGSLARPATAEVIFESGTSASASTGMSGCSDSAPPIGENALSYEGSSECAINFEVVSATARAANTFTVIGGRDNVTGFDVDTATNFTLSRADNAPTVEPRASTSIIAHFTVTEPMIFEVTGAVTATATDSLANPDFRRTDANVTLFFRPVGASGGIGSSALGDATQAPQNNNFDQQGTLDPGEYELLCFVNASTSAFGSNGVVGRTMAAEATALMQIRFTPVPPTGGCCIDGFCDTLSEAECQEAGGAYAGDDQDCVDCVVEECDLRWTNAAGGNLGTAANWNPAQAPKDGGDGCNNLTLDLTGEAQVAGMGGNLDIGSAIRVIREPYFGRLGTVTELPAQLMVVESGTEVRVLKANLEGGDEVCVPRANVEIIAT